MPSSTLCRSLIIHIEKRSCLSVLQGIHCKAEHVWTYGPRFYVSLESAACIFYYYLGRQSELHFPTKLQFMYSLMYYGFVASKVVLVYPSPAALKAALVRLSCFLEDKSHNGTILAAVPRGQVCRHRLTKTGLLVTLSCSSSAMPFYQSAMRNDINRMFAPTAPLW